MIFLHILPNVIDKEETKEYVFDLYSKLLKNRIIFIDGEITLSSSNIVIGQLLYLNSLNHDDIFLYINSPGGQVNAGMAIYDTMNFIQSDVCTTGIGLCASMAALLLSSGAKGKRYALENTDIMIHQPLGGASGQATELEIATNHILRTKEKINKILAKNTNKTTQKIKKDADRDYYLTSKEALEYGLIDKVI